ncbi:MAG: glycosyltransferase family 1 protein, partial [Lachnospiraceae bacterium]|nr:glycosyltransferase family 1 protein [Lachnospiraceae bacterium]
MNILVVHCSYRISGGEDRVVSCDIKLLREMGHKVVPYISSNKILDGAGTLARIKYVAAYLYPAKQRQEIIRIIKKDQIDVIWVHNTLWTLGT